MCISDWSSDVCSSDLIGFIQSSFTNQDSQTVTGLDFAVTGTFDVTDSIRLRSNFDASYLIKYELRPADGSDPLRYDRKSDVEGTRVSVRLDIGGRSIIKKKQKQQKLCNLTSNP